MRVDGSTACLRECAKTVRKAVKRAYTTFVGVDLGGARGKTTAVAVIEAVGKTNGKADSAAAGEQAVVQNVTPRRAVEVGEEPWTDEALLALFAEIADPCIAIDAPLTVPACVRCTREVCPGQLDCEDASTIWLQNRGEELARGAMLADENRIAVTSNATVGFATDSPQVASSRLYPYVHRCTEIELHYGRDVFPKERLGQRAGPVANRARHLVRRLETLGFTLHDNLIEVSPRATVAALFGDDLARGYKRDADPWQTRATILENIGVEMRFAAKSRLSREQCLANDNCFEALLSAFTAYLYARDGWTMPEGPFAEDGWIWSP